MSDFYRPKAANVRVKIALNRNGNIAQIGDVTASTKNFTIAGLSSNANLADTMKVFNAFIGDSLGGGDFDSLSASRTITEGVE